MKVNKAVMKWKRMTCVRITEADYREANEGMRSFIFWFPFESVLKALLS